ncbi:DNA polymerase I [Suttonella ornithocola]|uniref:DNA polymerase I n=1 Tax=Suttonella ornithocola TaxID=279832 RepID=A0A380MP35_9GAMM|nr:DNA polymerase I [Suttonella ornithocola]SUO93491.1 DNA polymerase I [Suttonella ornithocola]
MLDTTRLVVLVDGSSYLFRAFHGLPPLTNKAGHPTGALHGVIKMLAKLYDDYQPAYFGVIFDAKGKTFRHERYPSYKANRPPMPDDLRIQIEPLHALIKALGFPLIIEQGVEADDVIGTLAKRALSENYQVLISSGDKDMAQLLTHADISLIDTMKNEATTAQDVAKRFKVDQLSAEQVIDFLALVGDTSDNIPGIDKVGPKTAAKWLAQYHNIDNLIHNATKITGKIGDNLRSNLDQLRLSRELATINCDLPIATQISDLALHPQNPAKLTHLCDEYELNSIKAQYLLAPQALTSKIAPEIKNYQTITSKDTLNALIEKLTTLPGFAIDTETNSLDYMTAKLVGISIAPTSGEAYYLPLAHQLTQNLPYQETLDALRPILENEKITKIGQHLKYDRHILARHGIELRGHIEDTMLMSYCYNSTATRHNMDALADYYLNQTTTTFEDIAGKGAKQLTFDQIELSTASQYACEDADITLQLREYFADRLAEHPTLEHLYKNIEIPVSTVLYHMEHQGVKIDAKQLAKQSQEIETTLAHLEQQAYELAGETFNLSSPKQLQEILFDKLKLPIINKTPKGQPSTNEDTLETLAKTHQAELPKIILEHRSLAKLKSTYTDKLPELINPHTGRIHTSYHQAITSTGRLSSSDPNLQNIPIRTAEGRRIRQAFIAEKSNKILAADYSQIELRIMAHLSNDKGLVKAFEQGKDIHAATAAEIFGGDPDNIDRNHRRNAKAINFGLIYGMSAFGLARQLGIARSEAAEYIELYFARYPKVREYMETARENAREKGYVETLLGRRLYIPDIHSKNPQRRNAAERLAINAPMQGSAADIIKLAMIDIDNTYSQHPDCQLIMQVHDELVFEVHAEKAESYRQQIIDKMQNAYQLKVPLIVDAAIGNNWDEAH